MNNKCEKKNCFLNIKWITNNDRIIYEENYLYIYWFGLGGRGLGPGEVERD
jgi:hypothetical protein